MPNLTDIVTKGAKGIFYDINNADDKFFFGHYLNTARHNVFKIFNHILNKHGKADVKEDNLHNCELLNRNKFSKYINANDLYESLKLHLPVLEYLKENNKEEAVFETLAILLTELNSFRNYFSHYYYNEILQFQKFNETSKFKKSMPYLFDNAVSIAYKKLNLQREDFIDLYEWKADPKEPNIVQPYAWEEMIAHNSSKPTNFGLVFFTCLFLEPKDVALIISNIKGLKNTSTEKFKANRAAFTSFAVMLPKVPKLESSDIKLDMVNELFRVPSKIYKTLDIDTQAKYILTNEDTGQEAIMKRYSNRFDYFALRYFEDNKALDNIGFQLKIGEAYLAQYDKIEPGSGNTINRFITKQLNAFGDLQFFQQNDKLEKRGFDLKDLVEKQIIYLSGMPIKYMPQYNMVDNKIGLKLDYKKELPTIPSIAKKDKQIHNVTPFHFQNLAPDVILSTYELPNLYLYNYLYKKSYITISPIDFFKQFILAHNSFIEKTKAYGKPVAAEYGLRENNLPKKLQQFIDGKIDDKATVIKKLKALLNNTNKTLEDLAEQGKLEKGKGKHGFTTGSVATYIAKDIIFFMKPDGKQQKLSDFEYNTLQNYIAFFGSNRQHIDALLKQFKICGIQNENRHPFVKLTAEYFSDFKKRIVENQKNGRGKKFNPNNAIYSLLRFFSDYLYYKRRYLNNLLDNLNDNAINEISYYTKINVNAVASMEYKEPILLPRGIFNDSIVHGFQKQVIEKGIDTDFTTLKRCTVSYLLKKMMPDVQSFYTHARGYAKYAVVGENEFEFVENIIIDEVNDLKACQQKLKAEGSKYADLLNRIDNNELDIRLEQFRDRTLFMMLQEYFNNQTKTEIDLHNKSLQDFSKDFNNDEIKTILDIEIDMCLTLNNVAIKTRQPIKKYGEFRKVLKDRRINNLLSYFDKTVDWKIVQDELEYYNQHRAKALLACIDFEKALMAKYSVEIAQENGTNKFYKHSVLLQFYHSIYPMPLNVIGTTEKYVPLSDFRNKFLHNEIIDKLSFTNIFPNYTFTTESISKQIVDKLINEYELLKTKLL